jgi:hypothetical protein
MAMNLRIKNSKEHPLLPKNTALPHPMAQDELQQQQQLDGTRVVWMGE